MQKGRRTRQRILDEAVRVISAKGLEAVTIGPLAGRMEMSKSGLFAHFGSKEQLQIEALDAAAACFREHVLAPVRKRPKGLAQLRTLFRAWVDWAPRAGLPGGCPFVSAAAELDDREGPARDHFVAMQKRWLGAIEAMTRDAVRNGELRSDLDVRGFASELSAFVLMHHWSRRLLRDPSATARAKRAFAGLVRRSSPVPKGGTHSS